MKTYLQVQQAELITKYNSVPQNTAGYASGNDFKVEINKYYLL